MSLCCFLCMYIFKRIKFVIFLLSHKFNVKFDGQIMSVLGSPSILKLNISINIV